MTEDLIKRITDLKKARNAIIIAHNYQRPEVQDIADELGDSLELSRKASKTDADVIVFCGVHFMAETAKILCPEKTVLLPEIEAGCPMANMIDREELVREKAKYPGCRVVCYVNSTAAVKAESDICCTSANAVRIVQSVEPERTVLFVPDQYLGLYVMRQTGRKLNLWPGYCPTHVKIKVEDISNRRRRYPEAKVLVHPECRPDVIDAADEVMSTGGMIRYAQSYGGDTLIIGTETGILHRMKRENPAVHYVPVTEKSLCPNMKLTTLEKILFSLEDMNPRIEVPEDIRIKALGAVENMLKV